MWNQSDFARDLLAQRLTAGRFDWSSLREALVDRATRGGDRRTQLAKLSAAQLFTLWDAVGSGVDPAAEVAIAQQITARHVDGEQIDHKHLARLAAGLLLHGHQDEARIVSAALDAKSWSRGVVEMELSHPRFGGSHAAVIDRLNEVYDDCGLLPITLQASGGEPFSRLTSTSNRSVQGPLVTVIMSAWRPGDEILTAIRSVVNQTYQNWELIVSDDASGEAYDELFVRVSKIDRRIRVVRNASNAGTYVRRNEAMQMASGEFVTFHDSDDWSHPERLEVQVTDLIEHPGRIGNIVRHARATCDLSFVTNRGMTLGLTEPAIMFRRVEAIAAAGFYDSIRKGADREYRLRLETVTGTKIETIGPMAPLQLMLATASSLSGSDFGPGWMTAARVAYRNACDLYHSRVKAGFAAGRIDFPEATRTIVAPPDLSTQGGAPEVPVDIDVLLIADGRSRRNRIDFARKIALEIRGALSAGLSVGFMHSDSLGGHRGGPRLDPVLQALIDERSVIQVFQDQPTRAGLVVVRHANAVQGHDASRRPITTTRAIVVEDAANGDVRGSTFSVHDVASTVSSWLGVTPGWATIEQLRRIAAMRTRMTREPLVLCTFRAPSAQIKYEDQIASWEDQGLSVRFQRTFGSFIGADVVYGVGSMDAYLGLSPSSTPGKRLERTRRFLKELSTSRAALVRTISGHTEEAQSPEEAEARALLDEATTRFVLVDGAGSTPDPSRTEQVPFANPSPRFTGYPAKDEVRGRVLCLARGSSDDVTASALKTLFVTRTSNLSLRVVGNADDALITELSQASKRMPDKVTSHIGLISDAALVEEITAAEIVIVPEVVSLIEYQLAITSLAFGRPVLTPANEMTVNLQRAVGEDWMLLLTRPLTAERLDAAIEQSRRRPAELIPDLRHRDLVSVGARYAQILRDVARDVRETLTEASSHETRFASATGMELDNS